MMVGDLSRSRTVRVSKPPKKVSIRLPWPRFALESATTPLGIDVKAKRQDIIKIVYKFFKVEDFTMDELLQEVFLSIIHKNHTKSAHDPRKSSFGHYVYMVANNVCINLVHKKKKFEKERDSIDTPVFDDGDKTLLDLFEAAPTVNTSDDFREKIEIISNRLRDKRERELARFVCAIKNGANREVMRLALTWPGHEVTNREIRDFSARLRNISSSLTIEISSP